MSVVRKFGKPDLFITFTCNPNWQEVNNELRDGLTVQYRPDLVVRAFHIKLNSLINDIKVNHIFGKPLSVFYVVEFQKRGLPHAHILVILSEKDKIKEIDEIDKLICAELPNKESDPELFEIICSKMIHGPCGLLNPNANCMEDGLCKKNFPKEFQNATVNCVDGYPIYKRRENNNYIIKTIGHDTIKIDNRWVVPYNPYLCKK
jgi:hypothetical protein